MERRSTCRKPAGRPHGSAGFSTAALTPPCTAAGADCWLQYGDAAFKRMLSSVVDTDCWEAAREAAAEQRKGLAKQQDRAEGVMQSLTAAVQRLQLDLQQTAQQEQGWEEQVQTQKVRGCGWAGPIIACCRGNASCSAAPPCAGI